MPTQHARGVVHVSIDDEPAVVARVMLLNFLARKLLIGYATILFGRGEFAADTWFHPAAAGGAGLVVGVLEEQPTVTIGVGFNDVPAVVHHA